MAKVVNIHSGKEVEYPKKIYNVCSICDSTFCADEEGGIAGGSIGMLPVSFCPFCLSGLLDMTKQLLGIHDGEEEEEE
tara:strand:- start:565 stop:798 length:234 start_codon:yes stop_codon:yes gene_type:complete